MQAVRKIKKEEVIMIENRIVDREYRNKDFRELMKAPVQAINGLSENDAKYLKEAFAVTTIEDLANNKFFRAAEAIKLLAESERDLP